MPEPDKTQKQDDFEQFDEAQSFLQLLADMLNRLSNEKGKEEDEVAVCGDPIS